jgi:putative FmdB family regulatory protein
MDLWDEREVRIMPTYDFRCFECDKIHEIRADYDRTIDVPCPDCGAAMWRLFSAVPIHFKGKGWGGDKK